MLYCDGVLVLVVLFFILLDHFWGLGYLDGVVDVIYLHGCLQNARLVVHNLAGHLILRLAAHFLSGQLVAA